MNCDKNIFSLRLRPERRDPFQGSLMQVISDSEFFLARHGSKTRDSFATIVKCQTAGYIRRSHPWLLATKEGDKAWLSIGIPERTDRSLGEVEYWDYLRLFSGTAQSLSDQIQLGGFVNGRVCSRTAHMLNSRSISPIGDNVYLRYALQLVSEGDDVNGFGYTEMSPGSVLAVKALPAINNRIRDCTIVAIPLTVREGQCYPMLITQDEEVHGSIFNALDSAVFANSTML